jgi:hypothetical protein
VQRASMRTNMLLTKGDVGHVSRCRLSARIRCQSAGMGQSFTTYIAES